MAFKLVAAFAVLALASAIPVEHQQQEYQQYRASSGHQQQQGHYVEEHEHAPAAYEFSYSVHDEHTGDIKEQQETRKGDQVHGSYSLIDSDGHKRIVEYTADDKSGFNAVVRREPTDIKIPIPAPQQHYQQQSGHQSSHHQQQQSGHQQQQQQQSSHHQQQSGGHHQQQQVVQQVKYAPIAKVAVAPVYQQAAQHYAPVSEHQEQQYHEASNYHL